MSDRMLPAARHQAHRLVHVNIIHCADDLASDTQRGALARAELDALIQVTAEAMAAIGRAVESINRWAGELWRDGFDDNTYDDGYYDALCDALCAIREEFEPYACGSFADSVILKRNKATR